MTQTDLNICWGKQADRADDQLNATYKRVRVGLQALGIDPDVLVSPEVAWIAARDATCNFEASLVEGGSMQPMVGAMCVDRMSRAQTAWLSDLLDVLKAEGVIETAKPASGESVERLDHFLAQMKERLTPSQTSQLEKAQSAWTAYRAKACKVSGYDCMTNLTNARVDELKGGWVGETFW